MAYARLNGVKLVEGASLNSANEIQRY